MIGAEAVISIIGDQVIKKRVSKGYRIAELDRKIIKSRTKREAKVLSKLSDLAVPVLLNSTDDSITMSFIDGTVLKEVIEFKHSVQIATLLIELHSRGIMHGDLTTSNMILKNGVVHLIDFGLSVFTQRIEDYAVDLHLLDRTINSAHSRLYPQLMDDILRAYEWEKSGDVKKRLEIVNSRGRYKKHK